MGEPKMPTPGQDPEKMPQIEKSDDNKQDEFNLPPYENFASYNEGIPPKKFIGHLLFEPTYDRLEAAREIYPNPNIEKVIGFLDSIEDAIRHHYLDNELKKIILNKSSELKKEKDLSWEKVEKFLNEIHKIKLDE